MHNFSIISQSWFKRRDPTPEYKHIVDYSILGFELIDNHSCTIDVKFNDGTTSTLNARVSLSCTFNLDGTTDNDKWSIQGLDQYGTNLLIRVN